jgi:hypothetical protein
VTPVSLALVNGRIRTGDPRRPIADALAVAGEHLAAVGSSAEVQKLTDASARVIDLRGASVVCASDGPMLKRGGLATFVVLAADANGVEQFRVVNGVIRVDRFVDGVT